MGCLRRILALAVLVVAGALAYFYFGDELRGAWNERFGEEPRELAGPELAAATMARIEGLSETPGDRIALSGEQLQSLIDHRYEAMIPAFLASPSVGVDGGRVRVSGKVSTAFIEEYVDLGDAAGFLPDTADVTLRGHLIPADPGRVGLAVDRVTAARIPLPEALVARLLRSAGAGSDPDLGENVIPVTLPEPLESAYIHGDSIVLTSRG
jgi:hypothetical protein